MRHTHRGRTGLLSFGACLPFLWLLACASSFDSHIEEAQFHLDKGEYALAEASAQAALDSDPTSVDATFLLASALIGKSVLGENSTYLTLISKIQEDRQPGESNFATFVRIAPPTTAALSDLETARDKLIPLVSKAQGSQVQDVSLQLYVARLFEISGAVTRIGANTPDRLCNKDHTIPKRDGVPDGLRANALTTAQSARFNDNVNKVNADGARAGLPTDFALNDRMIEMAHDLNAKGTEKFFNDAFGNTGTTAICTIAK